MSIREWLVRNVENYTDKEMPPLAIEVDGVPIAPGDWSSQVISPASDVRMYPVPFDPVTLGWIAVGVAVATAAYSLFMMSGLDAGG
ncbi:hypothetical protein, partial [Klebsiella pneumoniae]